MLYRHAHSSPCTGFRHARSSSWLQEWSGKKGREKCRPRRSCVSRCSSRLLSAPELGKAFRSEFAGRAGAAAIPPVMAPIAIAQITAMAVLNDEIKKCFAADLLRHGESVGFIHPHQRGVDGDALIEVERQRNLNGFDSIVAAIRIAGIVGFAHPGDYVTGATPIGQCSCKTEKNQIAAWHEGRRKAAVRHRNGDLARESGVRDGSQRVEPDQMVIAKTRFPGGV